MKWERYMVLFKHYGEPWCAELEVIAKGEDDAYERALKIAEANGYSDFMVKTFLVI